MDTEVGICYTTAMDISDFQSLILLDQNVLINEAIDGIFSANIGDIRLYK